MEHTNVSSMARTLGITTRMNKKLLYIFDCDDWKSRIPLAKAAQDSGYNVTIGIVGKPNKDTHILRDFKVVFIRKPSTTIGPINIFSTIMNIRRALKKVDPDITHSITLKYSFLMGLASLFTHKHQNIYTLAGLGFLFRSTKPSTKILRIMLSPLLILIFRNKQARIIFQNPDDLNLFTNKYYSRKEQCHLVLSSGTDLDKFKPKPKQDTDKKQLTVLMPTRLVREKGVSIFVKAAHILKDKGIHANFQIAGGETKHNPRAITREKMLGLTKDGTVKWLGRVDNMPDKLAASDIIVYPSYYGEGVPRVMIEAAACGKAIITTDHPGCRETVVDGENGFLVPIKDAEATAHAIEKLIKNDKLRLKMEINSRKLAEKLFDINIIVKETLAVYET